MASESVKLEGGDTKKTTDNKAWSWTLENTLDGISSTAEKIGATYSSVSGVIKDIFGSGAKSEKTVATVAEKSIDNNAIFALLPLVAVAYFALK